jgi:hypothetical protein
MQCQNEIYSTPDDYHEPLRCKNKATVTLYNDTIFPLALCDDCANGGKLLADAAESAWANQICLTLSSSGCAPRAPGNHK